MEGLDVLKISEEKKRYILDTLNPVLEELVAECIHKMPRDLVSFMLGWLEQKKVKDKDKVSKVKVQMQEAAKLVADDDQEEEEEDDEDDEPPPDFEKNFQKSGARQSVSAEAYGEWNTKKAFVAPIVPKSDEQKDRLKSVLSGSFLFSSLEENDFGIIIGAMKEVSVGQGERVINQGESGDFLFVIESGTFQVVIKDAHGDEKVVKTCVAGDVFGELALLYNCPRAASVESKGDSVCWKLDRDTFNHIVKEAAQKKRNRYDAFLAKVPLLERMEPYERAQLADALRVETFGAETTIVTQGEVGSKFYIVEGGACEAKKGDDKVMDYGIGDYFGELALITDQPRQATIVTKDFAKLLSLDSSSFKRLLNVSDLLERSNRYT